MEDQCSPVTLSWLHCQEEEGKEELRRCFLLATVELQKTILTAREEISKRENEVIHLNNLLNTTLKERDAATSTCQKLLLENLFLQQQQQQQQQQKPSALSFSPFEREVDLSRFSGSRSQSPVKVLSEKPLPEKGKLLKAVMEAGPLLQTLLLAGPLPQWQCPPPQLETVEIPPATVPPPTSHVPLVLQDSSRLVNIANGCVGKKRGLMRFDSGSDFPPNKYQRVIN